MYRSMSILLALIALGLASWGICLWIATPGGPSALLVEDADRDLGPTAIGETLVPFRLTNGSSERISIIGLAEA